MSGVGSSPVASVREAARAASASTRPDVRPESGAVGGWAINDGLDWGMIAALRQQTADRLSSEFESLLEDRDAQRERGRAVILDLLTAELRERARASKDQWSLVDQERIAQAVFDAVFGLGRLQPLVDDEQVENIMINGHDDVTLELTGGRVIQGPPVADTDEELIDFLTFVATRSEVNARPFSAASPHLHMRLDSGARLAAAAWVTPRPHVVIRRHRLTEISLDDLVDFGSISPVAASFLHAAVVAGRSIVVSGRRALGRRRRYVLCVEPFRAGR
ncbi:hypothetical protein [Ornithinimicrobium sp. INDO-MA30-4]|uniref:hypothetical protein n=1 Tax=Ornithinimicrobium sp. INDO-MA30-4 TaxID=2908651 RepID=UPI001F43812E|nr:hypothetical protein [Ornithinimicrobium sp. INDO-MA30-4]UJH71776.1 hypothetical protein L0A91_16970 [Ornithinimicrobium sp. INDO-MA30-4]